MLRHALGHAQLADLLAHDLARVLAEHEMDFVITRRHAVKQTLEINRAAGTGRGEDEFHAVKL